MKTAIIYSRVSTVDKQDNARQIQELEGYARYAKLKVLKVYQEKVSGATKASERTEFKKLLEFIDANKVDNILIHELSRLGRSMKMVSDVIEELSDRGINIYIKKEGMNTLDANGKKSVMTSMLISILSGFAEMERETIRTRSASGIRHNVLNGGAGTGILKAYGFKAVNKKLVIDEEEADVVRTIFKKYLEGLGSPTIAKFLNEQGIKTRYNKAFGSKEIKQKYGNKKGSDYNWKDGTVYTILTNTIYKGERKHKGETFKIKAIISPDLFDKVQKRLSENYNKNSSKILYTNHLKDILVCGCCGQGYWMHQRANDKDSAYKCLSKRYEPWCGNPSIGIEKLLKSLYVTCSPLAFANKLNRKDFRDDLKTQIEAADKTIAETDSQIETLNKQMDNLIRLNIEGGLKVDQFKKFKADIEGKIERLAKRKEIQNEERFKLIDLLNSKKGKKDELMIDFELFKKEISKTMKKIVINPAPRSFKTSNKQDIGIKVTAIPILDKWPQTKYIITRRSDTIHYMGEGNKVVEKLPM